ncbi:cytochrome P450 [Streptomyces sp. NPDC088732]|uniref:cytochrome P450 family protein n=1 Tax=Streptomyces sp. NPDC088732 TaxID=3365879 RepID=UPI0038129082
MRCTDRTRSEDAGRPAGGSPVHLDAAFKADAPNRYEALRRQGPVHRAELYPGLYGWLVVDYDLAREALTHPALLKDPSPAADALAAADFVLNKPGVGLGGHMLEADGQDHTRLRRLVSGVFTPHRTAGLAPRVRQIAEDLIDAMASRGTADLVESFTAPLPMTVIAELLGIPDEHRARFRLWSRKALDTAAEDHRSSVAGLHGLVRRLIDEKRARPQDDLISALVGARDEDDGRLTDEELVGTCILMVIAGHDTTVNLLGNALLGLLRDPAQLRLLEGTPDLIPGAVEEFLRYDSSVEVASHRYAARDLELGGHFIPRGSIVGIALWSANRDAPMPAGEAPSVLDVSRPAARHLAFGHGIHHCLGAPLARLEATTGLEVLLRRIPGLEAAVPLDEIDWIPSGMIRGPLSLPVRYGPVLPRG